MMSMNTHSLHHAKALEAIRSYGATHRHPARKPLTVLGPYALWTDGGTGSWEGTDESYEPGCYLLFSSDDELVYIGKASHGKSVGDRLVRFRGGRVRLEPMPVTAMLVLVPEPFEAPSLEEYLIRELQPTLNTHGRRKARDVKER